MRLRLLFVDYDDGDQRFMPNAMAVSDEYLEENAGLDFWDEQVKRTTSDRYPTREAFVTIPDDWVRSLFAPKTIEGKPVAE